jgi:hypothetical protein
MPNTLVILPEAREEIELAFKWYEYEHEQVVIYSVFHSSQNPQKWYGRFK